MEGSAPTLVSGRDNWAGLSVGFAAGALAAFTLERNIAPIPLRVAVQLASVFGGGAIGDVVGHLMDASGYHHMQATTGKAITDLQQAMKNYKPTVPISSAEISNYPSVEIG